jgi:hypothetical protein
MFLNRREPRKERRKYEAHKEVLAQQSFARMTLSF